MKFAALLSGGKDSCYALHLTAAAGNELVAIINLKPPVSGIEIDSYMYQTVGQDVLQLQAKALNVPLFQRTITGRPVNQDMAYDGAVSGDEVEDLYEVLRQALEAVPFEAVSCGAIHSNYQRVRAENVCDRLGLRLLSPLWGREQTELLREMIDSGIDAILVKVAALGLEPKHLGRTIKEMFDELVKLNQKYGINVCGEGGEYETMTLACPMFKKHRIVIDRHRIVCDGGDEMAPVAYLQPLEMHID